VHRARVPVAQPDRCDRGDDDDARGSEVPERGGQVPAEHLIVGV
jgi:hypothetical protein